MTASVRTVVEFALLCGSLTPGGQLERMREGMLGHQARQRSLPDARAEVMVRGRVEGTLCALEIGGRIDVLYERDGLPVVEEIKLSPLEAPEVAMEVHRAQAVCYGHLLEAPEAIIRVLYVRMDGSEVASFEERMDAPALRDAFYAYVTPYLAHVEQRLRWMDVRNASIDALPFPFSGFRAGQREMAVQVFWAIKSRRRLFAQAPTGTGKTAAALFPALKALGAGHTGQLFYLTARGTGQENAWRAAQRMRAQGLRARALVMTAKEKICPLSMQEMGGGWRCDVLTCPRAIGYFDRLPGALSEMRAEDAWSRAAVEAMAERHGLCPFEFSLSLCEEADLVICDYNYAFDPAARIRRIFQWTRDVTLLVDEAHNLPDRAREMLSAQLDSRALRDARRDIGKAIGRKAPLYGALTALIRLIEAIPEGTSRMPPEGLGGALEACLDAATMALGEAPLGDLMRTCIAALSTLERFDAGYAVLTGASGRHRSVLLLCMDPAPHLIECTKKLRGTVYFSATLTPLPAWREVIGGTDDDGLLSLPSPFPEANFLVLRHAVSTTYRRRERTVPAVAEAIAEMARARAGNYLACFPSYAYMRQVAEALASFAPELTLHVQQGGMDDAARTAYLEAFMPRERGSLVGMVVMGGIFGEGVDLPGERLSGVAIVGVGLPQIGPDRELLRGYYDERGGRGFAQAYQYPGMNKVLQAVGRVIRTETDRGVALLIDERFLQLDYAVLMPPWWGEAALVRDAADIGARMRAFWEGEGT